MKKRSYRYLWIGQSFANLGDVFYIVGLIPLVYMVSESAMVISLIPFFNMLTRAFSTMIATLLFDRFNLKPILAFSQLGKTVVLLMLAIFVSFFLNTSTVPIIFVFVVLIALLDGCSSPARDAMLPRLVEKEELIKTNSFLSIIDRIIQLGGWPLGAVFVSIFSSYNIVWFTFVLYVIATVMMFFIKNENKNENKNEKKKIELNEASRFSGMLEGLKYIMKKPYLRTISIVEVIEANANVVWIAAIMYIYVDEVLGSGEEWWGYINSVFFLGLFLGGVIGLKYAHLIEKHINLLIRVGAFFVFTTTLMFSLISNPLLALPIAFIFGFSSQIKGVSQQTIVQTNVEEEKLPKVYIVQDAAIFATFSVSTLLFGFLTELYGARFIFVLSAVLLLVVAIYINVMKNELHLNTQKKSFNENP